MPFFFSAETVTEKVAPATLVCEVAEMMSLAGPLPAGPTGVTGADESDHPLVPIALVAVTKNVTALPLTRPVTVQVVVVDTQLLPSEAVTV